jgi:hypothetical protein
LISEAVSKLSSLSRDVARVGVATESSCRGAEATILATKSKFEGVAAKLTAESNCNGAAAELTAESNCNGAAAELTAESNFNGVAAELTAESNFNGVAAELTSAFCVTSSNKLGRQVPQLFKSGGIEIPPPGEFTPIH